jgi:hypothetical protein
MSTIVQDPGDAGAQCFDALVNLGDLTLDTLAARMRGTLAGLHIEEWLDNGKQLNLLETAHGRLAILICEDLNRGFTVGKLAADLGAALVLSPIFGAIIMPADPNDQKQWCQIAAEDLATEIGSRVAVANSMAVTRTYWHSTVPTVTLFTVRPTPPPVETHGVTVSRGMPPSGIDSAALPSDIDATTPRTAEF